MQFKFWLSTFVKPSPQSSEWTCPSCPKVFSCSFPSLSFLTPSLPKIPVSVDCVVCAELLQSCPALCNHMDCSSLGSSVHGDSPGKNTGVGCIACSRGSSQRGIKPTFPVIPSLQADSLPLSYRGSPCHYRYSEVLNRSVVSYSLWPHGLYNPLNSPGQDTGVGSFSLLQWIFPTQGSNPGLLHCRKIIYLLSHKGSPSLYISCKWSRSVVSNSLRPHGL